MWYLSEAEYQKKLKRVKERNASRKRAEKLRKEKQKQQTKIKLPSTSKIVLWAVILLNLQIVLFVEKAMMQCGDLSAAYALIGIPATLIPTVWGYYSKSKAENTSGGIVYDTAMNTGHSLNGTENGEDTDDEDIVG